MICDSDFEAQNYTTLDGVKSNVVCSAIPTLLETVELSTAVV